MFTETMRRILPVLDQFKNNSGFIGPPVNEFAQSFTIRQKSNSVKSEKLSFIKAKIIELSRTINVYQHTSVARLMRDALEAEYPDTDWVVFLTQVGQYNSRSYRSYDTLSINYNGFQWYIRPVARSETPGGLVVLWWV